VTTIDKLVYTLCFSTC